MPQKSKTVLKEHNLVMEREPHQIPRKRRRASAPDTNSMFGECWKSDHFLVVNDMKASGIIKQVFMMDGIKILFFHNLFLAPVWETPFS